MWRLYQTSKATGSRPSELMCLTDRWAAIQFDQAVTTFGMIITNAAEEQIQTGDKWVAKYDLADLLTPGFVIGGTGSGEDAPLPVGKVDGLIFDEVG